MCHPSQLGQMSFPAAPIEEREAKPALARGDLRVSQMRGLCQFLDLFASPDVIMRARAVHYEQGLREAGYDGEEIIQLAATALLMAIEDEIDNRECALRSLPSVWIDR